MQPNQSPQQPMATQNPWFPPVQGHWTPVYPIMDSCVPGFSFTSCTYHDGHTKAGCARRVAGALLPMANCYTFEISFFHTPQEREKVTQGAMLAMASSYTFKISFFHTPHEREKAPQAESEEYAFCNSIEGYMEMGKQLAISIMHYYSLRPPSTSTPSAAPLRSAVHIGGGSTIQPGSPAGGGLASAPGPGLSQTLRSSATYPGASSRSTQSSPGADYCYIRIHGSLRLCLTCIKPATAAAAAAATVRAAKATTASMSTKAGTALASPTARLGSPLARSSSVDFSSLASSSSSKSSGVLAQGGSLVQGPWSTTVGLWERRLAKQWAVGDAPGGRCVAVGDAPFPYYEQQQSWDSPVVIGSSWSQGGRCVASRQAPFPYNNGIGSNSGVGSPLQL
eukprot:gene18294-24754_t